MDIFYKFFSVYNNVTILFKSIFKELIEFSALEWKQFSDLLTYPSNAHDEINFKNLLRI